MNEQAIKAALKASFIEAIEVVGFEAFKATSMFPLSRRREMVEQKQAA